MIKQAPSPARIAAMIVFALSCFGLLLFLWLSFGGPVPLQPEGYRVKVAFPEATTLAVQADVRSAGVPIGKVTAKEVDEKSSRTVATLQIDERYVPISAEARAMIRQKTLLGESYVELTLGEPGDPYLPEGGRLPDGQVREEVQLDEVLEALDPRTREALQRGAQHLGRALETSGPHLNDAVGHLVPFTAEAGALGETLASRRAALRTLVRDWGAVFEALTEREGQLRRLVRSSADVVDATASQREALAGAIAIAPTFLDEARLTFERLERFAADTDPLVRDLGPAARDLPPTLRDARALAPDLGKFARNLDSVIAESRRALPAADDVLEGLEPLLAATGGMLSELNPVLEWLEYNQRLTVGLFNAGSALVDTRPTETEEEIGHYVKTLASQGAENFAIWPERLPNNRGNAYLSPSALAGKGRGDKMIVPSWDCNNTGRGEFTTRKGGTRDDPSCWRMGFPGWLDEPGKLPHIERTDYAKPR